MGRVWAEKAFYLLGLESQPIRALGMEKFGIV